MRKAQLQRPENRSIGAVPAGRNAVAGDAGHTSWVVSLAAVGRHDLAVAGGKGANLGELIRAGFPVPPGFCVTTAAYASVAQRADVDAVVAALAQVPADDEKRLAELAEAARSKLLAAAVPEAVATAVSAAYQALGGDRPVAVAVRSSATAEDLPTASFAGQQETYLNVVGVAALLDAVRDCWASLWTDRAVSYRAVSGVGHDGVQLAVVVQRMVDAVAAGVLFTANPVTGARGEAVIDAGRGLGEAVVSGRVTPDHYVVGKRTLRIKQRRLGGAGVVIRALPGGGTEEVEADSDGAAPVLSRGVVRALVRLGNAIERHYGVPQDIEWAWADGQLYALQARPVTALPQPVPLGRLRASMTAEIFPIRPYPLDVSTYTSPVMEAVMGSMFAPLGVGIFPVEQAFVEEDGVVVRMGRWGPRPTPRVLYRPWLTLWRSRHIDVADWQKDPALHNLLRQARELEQRDLRALDWQEVRGTLAEAVSLVQRGVQLRRPYFPPAIRDLVLFRLLATLAGQREHVATLLSGVETKTLELNRALEALAAQVHAVPALRGMFADASVETPDAARVFLRDLESLPAAGAFLKAFRAFLDAYGHRETVITLASQPTWKAAPEVPLGVIKALAAGEPVPESDGPPAWEQARDEVLARSILGRAPLRGRFLRLLGRARWFAQLREDTHFYAALGLPVVHRCFLEFGRRLVEADMLDAPEDVFHLKGDELETMRTPWPPPPEAKERMRRLVARRKAKRAALGERLPIDPRLLESPKGQHPDALLTGVPASPGVAQGPVRIIHGPSGFGTLQPGEVLVAPFTNPAWTPLFQRASAVVVDTGGAMSHAAIVAREYGIPAVMGVGDATGRLVDGQQVRVDGVRGAVYDASAQPS